MLGQNAMYRPPQQPQPRNPLRTVLIALLAVCLVTGAAIVAVNMLKGGDNQVTGDYQNEGYQPPAADRNPDPVPVPAKSAFTSTMEDNAFYAQTVPAPVRCEVSELKPTTASVSAKEKHLNALTACLMRVWDTSVQKAGYTLPRPTVTVYTSEVTTKCGKSDDKNAFYCAADQQIYFADDILEILPTDLASNRLALDIILGHEFGHALQGRTGILMAAKYVMYDLPEHDAYVYQRRLEMQADCLDGIFLNSVGQSLAITTSDREDISQTFYNIGDDVLSGKSTVWGNHGLGRNREAWGDKGLATTSVSACNTFTASDASVR
jgi:predicted metalloprotease